MWIGLREDHAIIRLLATSAHAVRITARNFEQSAWGAYRSEAEASLHGRLRPGDWCHVGQVFATQQPFPAESRALLEVKRTSGEAAACFGPTLLTRSGHRGTEIPQCSGLLVHHRCAIVWGWQRRR